MKDLDFQDWAVNEIGNHYGLPLQKGKAIEELGELIVALQKDILSSVISSDNDNTLSDEIVDEIADVTIVLKQLSRADLRWANLRYAHLRCADLRGANLRCADLRGADFRGATLRMADLGETDLREASFIGVDLREVGLRWAILRYASLKGVDLKGVDLRGADLKGADLRGANLRGADLRGADLYNPIACPEKGSFIGWKKANGHIVELEILSNAKRSSAIGRKCRCDKAKVVAIEEKDGSESYITEVNSNYDKTFIYRVGEVVTVDDFDDDRWNECAPGIHFFITREEAVRYP